VIEIFVVSASVQLPPWDGTDVHWPVESNRQA